MKNYLESQSTPLDSTRRETLKTGLALTLGSATTGMGALVASPAAQAWGPWHTQEVPNDVWQYLKDKLPIFFQSIAGGVPLSYVHGFIRYQNSNDMMVKQGQLYALTSDNPKYGGVQTNLANFKFGYSYDSFNHKDIYSMDIRDLLDSFSYDVYPTDELRRRLAWRNTNPYGGIFRDLYQRWLDSGTREITTVINIQGRTFSVVVFHTTDEGINSTISISRRLMLAFTETTGGQTGQTMRVRIDAVGAGGEGLADWQHITYVSIPDLLRPFDVNLNNPSEYPYQGQNFTTVLVSIPLINAIMLNLRGFTLNFLQWYNNTVGNYRIMNFQVGASAAVVSCLAGVAIVKDVAVTAVGASSIALPAAGLCLYGAFRWQQSANAQQFTINAYNSNAVSLLNQMLDVLNSLLLPNGSPMPYRNNPRNSDLFDFLFAYDYYSRPGNHPTRLLLPLGQSSLSKL